MYFQLINLTKRLEDHQMASNRGIKHVIRYLCGRVQNLQADLRQFAGS